MPTVSVIIPVYDRREFISEAIESVLVQTYKDIEIIVVDDGSTTDIKETLNPYLDKIKYVYQENRGLAAARNSGIRCSSGKYIAFLDDDDLFEPQKLENQVRLLEENPDLGFVFSDYYYFETGNKAERTLVLTKLRDIPSKEFVKFYFVFHDLAVSTFLVRRESIDDVGKFDEDLEVTEDVDFWLRLSLLHQGKFSDYPSACIRTGANRMSQDRILINKTLIKILKRVKEENPDFAESMGVTADKKIVKVHYLLGKAFFEKNQITQARKEFVYCAKSYPLMIKRVYFYLFFCLIGKTPANVILKFWRFVWNLF